MTYKNFSNHRDSGRALCLSLYSLLMIIVAPPGARRQSASHPLASLAGAARFARWSPKGRLRWAALQRPPLVRAFCYSLDQFYSALYALSAQGKQCFNQHEPLETTTTTGSTTMLIETNPTSFYRSHIISHGAAKNIAIFMRKRSADDPITHIHWLLNPNVARAFFGEALAQAKAGEEKATRFVQMVRNLDTVSFDTTFGVDFISRQPVLEQDVYFETEFKRTWPTNKWVADTGPRPARKPEQTYNGRMQRDAAGNLVDTEAIGIVGQDAPTPLDNLLASYDKIILRKRGGVAHMAGPVSGTEEQESNLHLRSIDALQPEPSDETEEDLNIEQSALYAMTMIDLRRQASALNIKGRSSMNKVELTSAIAAA